MGEDQKKRSSLIIRLKISSRSENIGGFQKEDSKTKLVPTSSVEEKKNPENYSSDATTDFTSHGISLDVVKSPLPQWSKTAKRGRKSLSPSASSLSSLTSNDEKAEEPFGEKEAVDALMHLWELSNRYSLDSAKKNQPKKQKVEDINHVEQTPIFRCDICEKSFSCYQALGGHKSSCKKSDVGGGSMRNTHNFSKEFTSSGRHQCEICSKTFLTGQALGGHKRIHRDEPKIVSMEKFLNPTNSLTSSVEGAKDDLTNKKIVMFDLNELPPDDEDECS